MYKHICLQKNLRWSGFFCGTQKENFVRHLLKCRKCDYNRDWSRMDVFLWNSRTFPAQCDFLISVQGRGLCIQRVHVHTGQGEWEIFLYSTRACSQGSETVTIKTLNVPMDKPGTLLLLVSEKPFTAMCRCKRHWVIYCHEIFCGTFLMLFRHF